MRGKKQRRKYHTLVKVIIVIAAMFIIGKFFSLEFKLDKAKADYEELKKEHAIAEQDTAELSDIAENGITDDYIIKTARQNGYIFPDERIFVDAYEK